MSAKLWQDLQRCCTLSKAFLLNPSDLLCPWRSVTLVRRGCPHLCGESSTGTRALVGSGSGPFNWWWQKCGSGSSDREKKRQDKSCTHFSRYFFFLFMTLNWAARQAGKRAGERAGQLSASATTASKGWWSRLSLEESLLDCQKPAADFLVSDIFPVMILLSSETKHYLVLCYQVGGELLLWSHSCQGMVLIRCSVSRGKKPHIFFSLQCLFLPALGRQWLGILIALCNFF